MKIRLRTIAIVALLVLVFGGAGAALMLYLGIYNVAATEQHTRLVFRMLDYAMQRSVEARSDRVVAPDLQDPVRIRSGAASYRDHCLQCHGAPGVAPHPLAFGLKPAPANLVATARSWQDEDMFWIIKHGVKMSGMPAWEYRLSDDEIWDTVAFLRAMAVMTPGNYAALASEVLQHRHAEHRHAAPHGAADADPAPARGDARAGRRATGQYLCGTCHVIPGVVGADHHVGPPLNGMGRRHYIAGIVPNTPDNMVRWLMNPQQLDPLSAMPPLGLTQKDARDIAAYLATLDDVE